MLTLKTKQASYKFKTLYDSTYIKYLKQSRPQKQKVEWGLPGMGMEVCGNKELLFNKLGMSVKQDEKVTNKYTVVA